MASNPTPEERAESAFPMPHSNVTLGPNAVRGQIALEIREAESSAVKRALVERLEPMPCGHPFFMAKEGREGTSYCMPCEERARARAKAFEEAAKKLDDESLVCRDLCIEAEEAAHDAASARWQQRSEAYAHGAEKIRALAKEAPRAQ